VRLTERVADTLARWTFQPTQAQRREAYDEFLRADHADNGCPYANTVMQCPVSCGSKIINNSPAKSQDHDPLCRQGRYDCSDCG
jgi:hypothetical protein